MPNKSAPSAPERRRVSAHFSPSDEFDAALDAAAHRQIGEAIHRRWAQMNIDGLVLRAIQAANKVDHDLTVPDFAKAVTAMLTEIVANGAVIGKLPSDERLEAIVLRHLNSNGVKGQS